MEDKKWETVVVRVPWEDKARGREHRAKRQRRSLTAYMIRVVEQQAFPLLYVYTLLHTSTVAKNAR